ncbi:autophagy-related 2 isoform a [Anaeramoeba flamelloides]|uniref:Autophagy-related protein 2 n=1 Tax=Anaeramoeba flamelloides TaxID=1746091 RepID=A0AAV8A2C8_9EUKA|nr:autophagy-related 2 isoform a [Anaeramoeba flamelloides]
MEFSKIFLSGLSLYLSKFINNQNFKQNYNGLNQNNSILFNTNNNTTNNNDDDYLSFDEYYEELKFIKIGVSKHLNFIIKNQKKINIILENGNLNFEFCTDSYKFFKELLQIINFKEILPSFLYNYQNEKVNPKSKLQTQKNILNFKKNSKKIKNKIKKLSKKNYDIKLFETNVFNKNQINISISNNNHLEKKKTRKPVLDKQLKQANLIFNIKKLLLSVTFYEGFDFKGMDDPYELSTTDFEENINKKSGGNSDSKPFLLNKRIEKESIQFNFVIAKSNLLLYPLNNIRKLSLILKIQNLEVIDRLTNSNYEKILNFRNEKEKIRHNYHPQISFNFSIVRTHIHNEKYNTNKTNLNLNNNEEIKIHLYSIPFQLYLSTTAVEFFSNFFLIDQDLSFENQNEIYNSNSSMDKMSSEKIDGENIVDNDKNENKKRAKKKKREKRERKRRKKKKERRQKKNKLLKSQNLSLSTSKSQSFLEKIYIQSLIIEPIALNLSVHFSFYTYNDILINIPKIQHFGFSGIDNVYKIIASELSNSLKKIENIQTFFRLMPGVESLKNVGSGVKDLVKLPFSQYRNGERVSKGLKMGVMNLFNTIVSEVIRNNENNEYSKLTFGKPKSKKKK